MPNSLTENIPKSTVIVGSVLWTVLFALIAWVLIETSNNGRKLDRVDDLRTDVNDHESRIRLLERHSP